MRALTPMTLGPIVKAALAEDIGTGDVTTLLTVPTISRVDSAVTAKADGVLAGMPVARAVFAAVDPRLVFEAELEDGAKLNRGTLIARVQGGSREVLEGERTALNFLQRMSGIATLTAKYVQLVSHTNAKIVDTRKTAPGLRLLDKYAVTVGGGCNHRFGLYDGILIKDNHIVAAGGLGAAVRAARAGAPHLAKVEVEVVDLDQLREAIELGADAVLLDNMPLEMMREAVKIADGRVVLEASGGVNEETVAAIAETGVDLISVGALTHSVKALDISLDFGGRSGQ